MDGCHLAPWGLLNTRDCICELSGGMEDAICHGDVWDREHKVLEVECVGDAFTPGVPHDNPNKAGVIGGMGEVPCLCSMIAP